MKGLNRLLRADPLHETPLPVPYDAAAMPGARVLGSDGRLYDAMRWPGQDDPYVWRSAAQIAEDISADVYRVVSQQVTRTVGVGGDHATLGDALAYFSSLVPAADATYPLGIVRILAGTVLNENTIQLVSQNMSWIAITSEDETVDVDAQGLTTIWANGEGRVFIRANDSALPVISTRFRLVNPAPSYLTFGQADMPVGLSMYNSTVFIGRSDRPVGGWPAGSTAPRVGFHDWWTGIALRNGSRATGAFYDVTDAKFDAVSVYEGSTVGGRGLRFTGALRYTVVLRNSTLRVSVMAGTQMEPGYAEPRNDFTRSASSTALYDVELIDGSAVVISSGGLYTASFAPAMGLSKPSQFGEVVVPTIGKTWAGLIEPRSFTVATLPVIGTVAAGTTVYVTNGAAGLPILAFSDGVNWLRCDTRTPVSAT